MAEKEKPEEKPEDKNPKKKEEDEDITKRHYHLFFSNIFDALFTVIRPSQERGVTEQKRC